MESELMIYVANITTFKKIYFSFFSPRHFSFVQQSYLITNVNDTNTIYLFLTQTGGPFT